MHLELIFKHTGRTGKRYFSTILKIKLAHSLSQELIGSPYKNT